MKPFAVGEAILFPKESVELGIQKGERAVLTKMFYNERGLNLSYQGKDGQEKNFYISQYYNFDYAYVMTFEQATGQQFKDTFIKVDSSLDYQKTVQALSHHQESCQLYADKARYPDQEELLKQLERGKPEAMKIEQTVISVEQMNAFLFDQEMRNVVSQGQEAILKNFKEQDIVTHYQSLNQEAKQWISNFNKTPEQRNRFRLVNQAMEEIAYYISTDSKLMKEATEKNLSHCIEVDKKEYLKAQHEKSQELKEKDIISYFQQLEKEVAKLSVMTHKTPGLLEQATLKSREIEKLAYYISENYDLMKEVQKRGLTESIETEREAYLKLNPLQVSAVKVEETKVSQEKKETLDQLSIKEIISEYATLEEKAARLIGKINKTEEQREQSKMLSEQVGKLACYIYNTPELMKEATERGLKNNISIEKNYYERSRYNGIDRGMRMDF